MLQSIIFGHSSFDSVFHADFKNTIHFGVRLAIKESPLFKIFQKNLLFESSHVDKIEALMMIVDYF